MGGGDARKPLRDAPGAVLAVGTKYEVVEAQAKVGTCRDIAGRMISTVDGDVVDGDPLGGDIARKSWVLGAIQPTEVADVTHTITVHIGLVAIR